MSRTVRSRFKHTTHPTKASMMRQTWISYWLGTQPLYEPEYWDSLERDGLYSDSNARTYKEWTNSLIRNQTRCDLAKLKLDPDLYEDMVLYDKHNAKKFIWAIW